MDERLSVGALMNEAPYSISEDETLLLAWEVVERSGQRHLPVVRQDGCCAGVLDRAELAVACADPAVALSCRTVRDLVHRRRTVTVHPEESTLRAAAVMTEEHLEDAAGHRPARPPDRPAHGAGLRGRRCWSARAH